MSEDILREAQEAFEAAVDAEAHNRPDMLDDVKFARLAEQWPQKIMEDREREGRPCLTINRLPSFIRQVVNDARQNRPQISVTAVDSKADPKTAEILSGLIRHIERNSDADVAYDTAIDWSATSGLGYWTVEADYIGDDSFEQDLFIRRVINPFAVYGDPDSEAADSSDWRSAFQVTTLSEERFEQLYGEKREQSSWGEGAVGDAQPLDGQVRVARYWKIETESKKLLRLSSGGVINEDDYDEEVQAIAQAQGIKVQGERRIELPKVRYWLMSGSEVLEKGDWIGKYIPIIPVYGEEVTVEGKRYFRSLVRDVKDPQRMFNYWRTASTELVALAPKAPFIGKKGTFKTDAKKWKTANTQNWPYIEYDGETPPQRQPFDGAPAGALQEALNAADDMKSIMGIYDASLGARSNETSGRAIMARQREGDVSTFHLIDNLSRAIRHTGRILVDLIPKVYDTQRVIRILGKDETPSQVTVNGPTQDEDGIERIYDLQTGRYDVAVKAGPSYTTQREEAAIQMTELIRSFPDAAPVIGDLIAKNLDWPGADEIAERLQGLQQSMQPQAAQAPPQDPNKQVELQIKQLDVQIAQINAETKRIEAQVRMAEAESKRAQATAQAMTPQAPPTLG